MAKCRAGDALSPGNASAQDQVARRTRDRMTRRWVSEYGYDLRRRSRV